jgi:hypothetical protein
MAYRTGLYALPIAGRFIYEYDRMKDYGKMAKDYRRNTGRTSKYATQGYEAQMYRQAGQLYDSALSFGTSVAGRVGRSTKDVTKL